MPKSGHSRFNCKSSSKVQKKRETLLRGPERCATEKFDLLTIINDLLILVQVRELACCLTVSSVKVPAVKFSRIA